MLASLLNDWDGGRGEKPWFVAIANFPGVNSLTMADCIVNNGLSPAGASPS